MSEMSDIHHYYEAACTATYLMENYGVSDENESLEIGYEVRRMMDKYGYCEEEAISMCLKNEY